MNKYHNLKGLFVAVTTTVLLLSAAQAIAFDTGVVVSGIENNEKAKVKCDNKTTDEDVTIEGPIASFNGQFVVMCEDKGLVVNTGDLIKISIQGTFTGAVPPIGHTNSMVSGLRSIDKLKCENKDSDQKIKVTTPPGYIWNCEKEGLIIAPGEQIKQKVEGYALGQIPNPPQGVFLSASADPGKLVLSWSLSTGADSYNIYKSTAPIDNLSEASVFRDIVSPPYTDADVVFDVRYYYVITAANTKGESPASLQIAGLSLFDHSGTTAPCINCHLNLKPLDPIHDIISNNCEDCHISTASWLRVIVNHDAITSPCSTCHIGIPTTHIQTSSECDVCHSTVSWVSAIFNHDAITSPCSTCHGGVPATHIQTTSECDVCHSTVSWLPAIVNHDAITSPCSTCHVGIPATHIQTTSECDVCHSTVSWVPAIFNHDAITSPCSTCHGGIPVAHLQTTNECDACHSTTTWVPAIVNHDAITSPCSACHYPGGPAQSKPATHILTNLECDVCHTTVTWVVP